MTLLAIGLVLLSAVLHALRNYFAKATEDTRSFLLVQELITLAVFLVPAILIANTLDKEMLAASVGLGLLTGLPHALYWLWLSRSLEEGDLSHVYPLMRSSPALVLLINVLFLGEDLQLLGIIGVLLTSLGVYLINLTSLKRLFEPIRAIFHEKATRYATLTLLAITAFSILDGHNSPKVNMWVYIYCSTFLAVMIYSVHVVRTRTRSQIAVQWKRHRPSLIAAASISLPGYLLILAAFRLSPVSYVVGMRQTSVLIAILLGGMVLKEGRMGMRFLAGSMIVAGALLISFA